jgi:hypothetical protein
MKFLLLFVVACIVLFFAGLLAPARSRRLQQRFARLVRRGEQKSDRNAGKLGDATERSLRTGRRMGDRSAEAGRSLRRKLPL